MNINIKVNKDFERALTNVEGKYGEDFEILNGFHESQLNFSDFIDGFVDKNVADVTIDGNANAHHKDICSLVGEKGKSEDKLFAFNKIFYELKKKYGLKTAKEWLDTEYSGGFYLHDAPSATFKPYCYAYDLTRLAKEGLFFLDNYNNEAPKHLTTFLDDVIEFISFFSNRSSGACGIPNVLLWTFYFWKKDVESGYYLKNPDYYIRQCFQKFIYRMNQPFLRVDQSAFVNVSIFDRNYYEALFGGVEFPDGTYAIDYMEEFIEHQKIFMEVVSAIRSQNMFTFPVLTFSLLFRDGKFVDEPFARWCSDHNTVWNDSNFFQSGDVGTLSNCCFDGRQMVRCRDKNGEYCTTFKLLEERGIDNDTLEVDTGGKHWKKCRLIVQPMKQMYKISVGKKTIYCTEDHLIPSATEEYYNWALEFNERYSDGVDYVHDVMAKDIKVGDYICVISKGGWQLSVQKVTDISPYKSQYNKTYCFEMEDQNSPYFVLANNILVHNCRLLSDTTKLDAFINSIGGTALSIGSIKVNTINLMRIAYESEFNEKKYLSLLKKRTLLCCKTLDVIRHIIKRNIEKGLLPNYCDGGVEMSRQYCTLGILGLFEVIESFGYTEKDEFGNVSYTDKGIEFADKIFKVLNEVKDGFTDEYSFNIESVPAERAAVILCQKDNLLYEKNDKFIYSNQWIPLSEKCTLQEKLRLSSILDAKCSGGAIAHINLEQNFPNTDVAWEMLNYIAKQNVFYFAFNTRINECKNHHGFVGTDICPVCGEPVFDTYQRIVGFLEPRRSYSKDRKREFDTRKWYEYAQMKAEI